MTDPLNQLIEALRDELKEYGEMLALLDEQQEHVFARQTDGILESVTRINAQSGVLRHTRVAREEAQRRLAVENGRPERTGLFVLAQALPETYRPLLVALVHENNQLLTRVQQRARQNHLLLGRSMELMQRLIQSLAPGRNTTTYGGNGTVYSTAAGHVLYEAVG